MTGGANSTGGTTATGGATASGGTTSTGGLVATGGLIATGGNPATGGTVNSDLTLCKAGVGGAVPASCGPSGAHCYADSYCASDGTCKTCTTSGSCTDTGCRDCCSGFSSDNACVATCTANKTKCLGQDCKDCCSGLSSEGTCVECNKNSDCTCTDPVMLRQRISNCISNTCVGTCTSAGNACVRSDCNDCCNFVSLLPQKECSCTPAGNACARSDCFDCCGNYTSAGRCTT